MIEIRPFATLGGGDHGWLQARHHFSFGGFRDPARMNWGALRVWNDDSIAPGSGFPTHDHEEMEIITYVREGAISHRDSLGNRGRLQAGDVQVMSAGSGVSHSEYNLEDRVTRIFQIWILPNRMGPPSWAVRSFPSEQRNGRLAVLASGFAEDVGALVLRADARLLGATLRAGQSVTFTLRRGRHAYLVAATGRLKVGGVFAGAGDGVAIRDDGDGVGNGNEEKIEINTIEDSEFLIVDSA